VTSTITDWDSSHFHGAKLAVIWQEQVLSLQRDDRTGLVFPGWWDLPRGGREGAESPFPQRMDCVWQAYGKRHDVGELDANDCPQSSPPFFMEQGPESVLTFGVFSL
jgi:8-oxo-dGTP pyrophosphatase MutT (NUDIX family)